MNPTEITEPDKVSNYPINVQQTRDITAGEHGRVTSIIFNMHNHDNISSRDIEDIRANALQISKQLKTLTDKAYDNKDTVEPTSSYIRWVEILERSE